MSAALTVTDLTRLYPSGGGIRNISFTAAHHAVTAIIGPNGAGKTVLFSIIAGLAPAQSGNITLSNQNATVAYCPDVPQFEPWLTACEVVLTSLALTNRARTTNSPRKPETHAAAHAALDSCGLGSVAHRRVTDFSRGMLQRLGIAAALVTDPDVLILDEPNSALDPIGRADIRNIINAEKQRRCILLSSHLLSEIEHLADHIVVLDAGETIAQGTTNDILTQGLEPVWTIRLSAPSPTPPHELHQLTPAAQYVFETTTLCRITFDSFEAAATHLIPAIHALAAPVIEVTLRDRDLDASFARIIQNRERA